MHISFAKHVDITLSVIIILVFCIVATLLALLNWEALVENITVAGTVVSTIAAIATAWAAAEARKGSRAAISAVEETRQATRRERFEQHYSLLLGQHAAYYEKLTAFLDGDGRNFLRQEMDSSRGINRAALKLYAHPVISPYMRVLYHLLKHINEDYYGHYSDTKGRKKYSSLVRSVIRNDVLTLVALNGLMPGENNQGLNEDFRCYQHYLNKFDFFQHVDFFYWGLVTERVKHFSSLSRLLEREIADGLFSPITACLTTTQDEWEACFEKVTSDHIPNQYVAASFNYVSRRHDEVTSYINTMPARLIAMLDAFLNERTSEAKNILSARDIIYGDGRLCTVNGERYDIPDVQIFERMLTEYAENKTLFGHEPKELYFFNEKWSDQEGVYNTKYFKTCCESYEEIYPYLHFSAREDRKQVEYRLIGFALVKLARRLESLRLRHSDGALPEKLDKVLLAPARVTNPVETNIQMPESPA